MSRERVLAILTAAGGEYVSGEALGEALGVSRAAVSKAVAALRQEGYDISGRTNRGYRLESGPDQMTEGTIRPFLHTETVGKELFCFPTIDSTNRFLKEQAMDGLASGAAAVANHQTAGRGRLGRTFLSPRDRGIYLSVLLRPRVDPARAANITACVAVAVCDGIEDACGLRPSIKWTNDLLLGGRKICGILTEMGVEGETGALQYLVTGIGVNANHTLDEFPPELRDVAGSIAMALGHPVSRAKVAAAILNRLDEMYAQWVQGKWDIDRYRADCITIGREVRILRGEEEKRGFAEGVDDDFSLLVRYPDGSRERVRSGEVSVRGIHGYQ